MRLWWRYDLSKAAFFLREGGWRLRAHVLQFRHFALLFVWRETDAAWMAERAEKYPESMEQGGER